MSCEKRVSLSPQEAEKQEDSRCLGRQRLQADRRYLPTETKCVEKMTGGTPEVRSDKSLTLGKGAKKN